MLRIPDNWKPPLLVRHLRRQACDPHVAIVMGGGDLQPVGVQVHVAGHVAAS